MGRDKEKKTVRQHFLDWWLPVTALMLVLGAGWSFYLWSDRNYGQLTTSLITVLGVVVTLWMTQVRAIEQQEREDKRHHARLTAESKKDRAQRSITQRIDLAEKLVSAVEHLSSENELKQAAGVQEILFQRDDWHTLIETEISAVKEEGEGAEVKKVKLQQESLRHRQELFDIAYKFDTKNVELLKSRARGLKQRLVENDYHSLIGLDFSGMMISWPRSAGEINFQIDLKELNAKNFIMSNSRMYYVDLSYARLERANLTGAHLEGANLTGAHLEGANLAGAHLEGANLTGAHLEGVNLIFAHLEGANLADAHLQEANLLCVRLDRVNLVLAHLQGVDLRNVVFDRIALRGKKLLDSAEYDDETKFPDWLDPDEHGMRLVDETEDE